MSELATQREQWDGHPVELGDAWTLRKGERLARCALYSHPLGWELSLMVGELVRSQVCRIRDEILSTQENWAGGDGRERVALNGIDTSLDFASFRHRRYRGHNRGD